MTASTSPTVGADIKAKFDNEWGSFRKFIAAHPLTGFWIGVVLGGALVYGVHALKVF